jgi:tetratricopeptide (TPR) repeat protein
MKKLTVAFFLVFLTVIAVFASSLDRYVFVFDDEKLVSDSKELSVLGFYLKYWKSGYEEYKSTANTIFSENMDLFFPDDTAVLDIFSSINPQEFLSPGKKFRSAKETYPQSIIINAFFIEFLYSDWERSGEIQVGQEIIDSCNNLEQLAGTNPLSSFYKAKVLWKSKVIGDSSQAIQIIKDIYTEYSDNIKILYEYIVMSYQNEDYKKATDLYENYIKLGENADEIHLIAAKSYLNLENKDKARELASSITKSSGRKNILASTYELLGDIAQTNVQKINYYKLSLEYDEKNGLIWSKLGVSYLQEDRKENAQLARVILNKALSLYPNQPEIRAELDNLQRDIKIKGVMVYILPLLGIVIGGITVMIVLEKRKKNKEYEEMLKK